ncbi:Endonuclease-reverse transcriptase [Operophtera brumata]|uniref:Endonuclease-reverse transcriptase n=1 Tax=Operophtera brumata TaxID=104452 RepID=A0A0L7LC22_OPEBR|nr:Endonuclease-reverse transcriptase [Operophtera brumata]
MEALDEKIRTIVEENNYIKKKISELDKKLKGADREKRKSSLVFFGVEEKGKSEGGLVNYIKDIIVDLGVHMNSQEISNVFRLWRQTENKNRPVLVSITTRWKKYLILKNKPNLPPGINVKEDFSKESLEKQKQLQLQVEEEKKKGNIAYIRFDKLIVIKPKENTREKRKRETSSSPNSFSSSSLQMKGNTNKILRNPEQSLPKTYTQYTELYRASKIRPTIGHSKKLITASEHRKKTTVINTSTYINNQPTKRLPLRPVPAGVSDHHPLTRRIKTLKIATLNTRTLRTEESLHELEKALEDIDWDILDINEIRKLGEKIEESSDYILFHKGEIAGLRGVGFRVKLSLKRHILQLIGITDRIAVLNINIPGYRKPWSIIQISSPTEQATRSEIKKIIQRAYTNSNKVFTQP